MRAFLLALFLSLFFSQVPVAQSVHTVSVRQTYQIVSDLVDCRVQPTNAWCNPVRTGHLLPLSAIIMVDITARSHFTYHPDPPQGDDVWYTHVNEVLANVPWQGDCDDLALTTAHLLVMSGADTSRMWRLLVTASGGPPSFYDHIVTIIEDNEHNFWVVGDTFNPIYRLGDLSEMNWSPRFINRVSEGTIWRYVDIDENHRIILE